MEELKAHFAAVKALGCGVLKFAMHTWDTACKSPVFPPLIFMAGMSWVLIERLLSAGIKGYSFTFTCWWGGGGGGSLWWVVLGVYGPLLRCGRSEREGFKTFDPSLSINQRS